MSFNKIKYWSKKLYLFDFIYRNSKTFKIFNRAFNLVFEINDYLFNLEDD